MLRALSLFSSISPLEASDIQSIHIHVPLMIHLSLYSQ